MATFIYGFILSFISEKMMKKKREKIDLDGDFSRICISLCNNFTICDFFLFNFVKTINKKKFLYAEDSSSMIHWNVHEGSVRHMQNISWNHAK